MLRQSARKILRRTGYDVQKFVSTDFSHRPIERRLQIMNNYGVSCVFDIGANIGQYAEELRRAGYEGRIVSFEPLSSAYKILKEKAAPDELWETVQTALGDHNGASEINIAANSQSSSLLQMLPAHLEAAPHSGYIGSEEVVISRLDTILEPLLGEDETLFVKIDAQGFEKKILDGARNVLHLIHGIQVESSLVALYDGEILIEDMIAYMRDIGFTLMGIEPGFSDFHTGQLLQADLIFFQERLQIHPVIQSHE